MSILSRRCATGAEVALLDVRSWEFDLCAIEGSSSIPHCPNGRENCRRIARSSICHHGGRSAQATAWLRHNGFDKATNLMGGVDAWARRIDPTMKVY